jgi:hypothetical protein
MGEREETDQEITPSEGTNYSSLSKKLFWNHNHKDPKKENLKHLQIEI